jgi:hypothetical protein
MQKISKQHVSAIAVNERLLLKLAYTCEQASEQCMVVLNIWIVRLNP